jgi:acetylornithine aminotransferase
MERSTDDRTRYGSDHSLPFFISKSDVRIMSDFLMSTYARLPITFERGKGPWLWDTQGQRYLDALSGIGVCNLGHSHPAVTKAICEQASKLSHTSNLYGIDAQSQLAERLCAITEMDAVFFCNSGAEANEAAIKLARLYGHRKGVDKPTVIVMENSFHGRTLATLTATGNRKVQAGFEPLVQGFSRVPYNDLESVHAIAQHNENIVAILLEPVQGEGGLRIPDDGYLTALRRLCDQQGWLMMLDEVQSGMGRTGKWFCYQHDEAAPDVLCLAKALGNGFPMGACLARGEAAKLFSPGTHGSTFGGNPLACRAAMAVLDTIENEGLCERAAMLGRRLKAGFSDRLTGVNGVRDIRNRGLMIGIELDRPCGQLVARASTRHLLINVTAENVIRLLPPLIIDAEEAEQIVDTVSTLILEFLASGETS